MAKLYILNDHLKEMSDADSLDEGVPVIEILSLDEFSASSLFDALVKDSLRSMTGAESTFLDVFPTYFIGSFAVPDKQDLLGDPISFMFYLDKTRLIFIDDGDTCQRIIHLIAHSGVLKQNTLAHCLFEFMKLLIRDDLDFLAALEDRMEDVEESIIELGLRGADKGMVANRRKLLRIDTFYQRLVDMDSGIAENENNLLTREESRLFILLEKQAERLLKRSQTLKEYSLQLRELYQTQIDVQQNKTMRLLTVITVLFAPLTLITGWFGMNFQHIPGLSSPWGYYSVIVLCIILVTAELFIFKRKKWL